MKKIFALGLAMMLCAASMTAQAACACDGWDPLPEGTLPAGNYCLGQDTYANGNREIASGSKVKICLHGKTLIGQITVEAGEELELTDCQTGGKLTAELDTFESVIQNAGTLTIMGNAVVSASDDFARVVENAEGGMLTITDNAVVSVLGDFSYGVNNMAENKVTLSGNAAISALRADSTVGMSTMGIDCIGRDCEIVIDGGRVEANTGIGTYMGKLTINGGTIKGHSMQGVDNRGSEVVVNGGIVESVEFVAINNLDGQGYDIGTGKYFSRYGTVTINDGLIRSGRDRGINNTNIHANDGKNLVLINGGTVIGKNEGVYNNGETFHISAGTIEATDANGQAVKHYDRVNNKYVTVEESEASCILPGSALTEGSFGQKQAVVEKVPQEEGNEGGEAVGAAGDLPQTGDASMLGAWVCLLGAAGMGLKLKKKH